MVDRRGELVTARTRRGLLGLSATLRDDGEPAVDGERWDSGRVAARVAEAAGEGARLVRSPGGHRFDDTALLLATDGGIAALGVDGRRLRPNVLIGGVPGLAERDWPGRRLRIGAALIAVDKLCERCVMTTIDPDTLAVDPDVLRTINARFDGRVALNAAVVTPGLVRCGDPVELV